MPRFIFKEPFMNPSMNPSENSAPLAPVPELQFVDLQDLEPEEDPSEVQTAAASDPGQDSPGDDAVLEQEELYEGIASERMPSEKRQGS
jgi:hypothetical protein